ncbi:MAG: hypothetical protein KJ600_03695 [Nanoarchaeota archaeon]|nr:hypothetical protein [Nanoarchaeota archaeon]
MKLSIIKSKENECHHQAVWASALRASNFTTNSVRGREKGGGVITLGLGGARKYIFTKPQIPYQLNSEGKNSPAN